MKPNRTGTSAERWAYLDKMFTLAKRTFIVVLIIGFFLKFFFGGF